jgi:YD repeat-containing protein
MAIPRVARRPALACRILTIVLVAALAVALNGPHSAAAYTFGEPGARQAGAQETAWDWDTMRCETAHIPDLPVRAFRDSQDRVQLIMPHVKTRRMIGPSLDALSNDCTVLMDSSGDPDPSHWNMNEWLASTYTQDGVKVNGLVHEEYQGYNFPGQCASQSFDVKCWYNAVTTATSTDGGNSYSQPVPPAQHVASVPYQYTPDSGPSGVFSPSNIIRWNGWYYALAYTERYGEQDIGTCVLRTQNLDDPTSWRAWDGTGYNARFIDPYLEPELAPQDHVCAPASFPQIEKMRESLTWNSYFKKFLLIGTAGKFDPTINGNRYGFWYSLSDDLVNWSSRKLLMEAELFRSYTCGDDNPVSYPSLLDPDSPTRNFETSDQEGYLYFTRFNYSNCVLNYDRDLIRIPVEFSDRVRFGPTASFTATPGTAGPGEPVTFDGSASVAPGGTITKFEWDFDDDGNFDSDTGTTSTTTHAYPGTGDYTARLRVTDQSARQTTTTHKVTVRSLPPVASLSASPNPAYTSEPVTFDASASHDPDPAGAIVSFLWDLDGNGSFETNTGATATASRTYSAIGAVTVSVRVTDDSGKAADTTTDLLVRTRAPSAAFTAVPNPSQVNTAVTFDGSGSSDADGSVVRYEWDLDGNGTFETNTNATPTTSKAYATGGSYTVGLKVTDDTGATGQTTRTQNVNKAPVPSFTATPSPSQTNQAVTFDGSASSDPDGTITKYEWDLDGDGTFETNSNTTPTATKVYTAPGSVTVRLRVTDNGGAAPQTITRDQMVKYAAKFNFQPASAPIPAGYIADAGAAYAATRGYGWVRQDSLTGVRVALDLTKNVVDRNLVSDQRQDTLIFMQAKAGSMNKTAGGWEVAVPNGSYTVTVSVGDAGATDSTHRINVENVNAINNFVPSGSTRFRSATVTVTVSDARLTIDARNGTNTKLNYVDISGA